jgi:hypothetical protein
MARPIDESLGEVSRWRRLELGMPRQDEMIRITARLQALGPDTKKPAPGGAGHGVGEAFFSYEPFWHTDRDSPWNVNQLFTLVLGGAPKYGSVTRSCRL